MFNTSINSKYSRNTTINKPNDLQMFKRPLTDEEKKEAFISIEYKNNKYKNRINKLENLKEKGPMSSFADANDIMTYYMWQHTRWGEWYYNGLWTHKKFYHNDGSQRKLTWQEWCEKDFVNKINDIINKEKEKSRCILSEEKIHIALFAQTLYSETEEQIAMDEADKEFEYLEDINRMQICFRPKLKRSIAIGC